MPKKTIRLKYLSAERFLYDYAQLRKGRISLPAVSHLATNTNVSLKISVPDVGRILTLQGVVIETHDNPDAARLKQPVVMHLGFNGGSQDAIRNFNKILSNYEKYRAPLGLPTSSDTNGRTSSGKSIFPATAQSSEKNGALSMGWIRKALATKNSPPNKKTTALILANTDIMAKDVQSKVHSYVNRILHIENTADAVVLLRLFRHILPTLIRQADWKTALLLTRAVERAAKTTVFFAAASDLPANPLEYVYEDHTDNIAKAYAQSEADHRKMINKIAVSLEALGIDILAKALSACKERSAGEAIMATLIKKGDLARNWILAVLDAPGQKWYLKRTALMLLKYFARKEEEVDRARKLVSHEHPRVREEALRVLISLKSFGAMDLAIAALEDDDEKVRWRAMSGLSELAPISENSIKSILRKITAAAPEDKQEADQHHRNKAQLIRALGAIPDIPDQTGVEETILGIVRGLSNHKKGLLKRLNKSCVEQQSIILAAAVNTLGNIGTTKSEPFLEKLAGSESPQAEFAQKAANNIRLRYIALLSNAPPDTGITAIS